MPIYEYRCSKCGKDFELMRPFSQANEPARCPTCGAAGERLISNFASTFGFGVQGPTKQPLREPAKKSRKRPKTSR